MSRYILPFPALCGLVVLFTLVWFFQWLVISITSRSMSEEVWIGVCEPQELRYEDSVELPLHCNGEETTTSDGQIIGAWINDRRQIECTKVAWWNSDDVSWSCQTRAEDADEIELLDTLRED